MMRMMDVERMRMKMKRIIGIEQLRMWVRMRIGMGARRRTARTIRTSQSILRGFTVFGVIVFLMAFAQNRLVHATILPETNLQGNTPQGNTPQEVTLRAMTFNIRFDNPADGENRWELRRDFAADLIRNSGASIIGTQEGLVHQLDFLDEALPDFRYVGVGRDDGAKAGEFTAIFVDTTQFTIRDSGTFWLSETPERPSVGWDASMERIATYVMAVPVVQRATLPSTASPSTTSPGTLSSSNSLSTETAPDTTSPSANPEPVLVINAHFDHIGEQARLESARLIIQKARELSQAPRMPMPVILMGDFNASTRTPPIQAFLEHYQDAFEISKSPPEGPMSTFTGFVVKESGYREPEGRIDYVFVNERVDVMSYRAMDEIREGRYVSDHFPVLVEVVW